MARHADLLVCLLAVHTALLSVHRRLGCRFTYVGLLRTYDATYAFVYVHLDIAVVFLWYRS